MKFIKGILIVVLIVVSLASVLVAYVWFKRSSVRDEKNLEQAIDAMATKHVAKGNSNALIVGFVKNGKAVVKGYSPTGKTNSLIPDSNTTFELASTSKLFTTATLQILADKGVINLDDKIQTLLGDRVQLPAIAQSTTLRHLATHLSGFPTLPNSFLAKMKDDRNPYKDLVTQDIYDYLKTCEGKQADGTFEYSNFGMGLLGHLMALKTGVPYEQLVKQYLLVPLGMTQTFVSIDSTNKGSIVQGYDESGQPTPIWEDKVLTGAGSFLSNGNDMLKFIKANLQEQATPVSISLIKTHQQQLNGETGLGWILPGSADKLLGNESIVWHNGMAGGYASFIAIDKANNFGLFVLSNKAVDVTKLGMKLTMVLRTQSFKDQQ